MLFFFHEFYVGIGINYNIVGAIRLLLRFNLFKALYGITFQ